MPAAFKPFSNLNVLWFGSLTRSQTNFDVLDNEADAAEINQKTQDQIEEVEVADRVFFDLKSSEIIKTSSYQSISHHK